MKVSYIITTFNRQTLLERAVDFVIRERIPESELIVVDDCSAIPVSLPPAAVDAFGSDCRLIRNPVNLGVIGARNAGLFAAIGEYVLFLDDDDESMEYRTRDLLAVIDGSPHCFAAARSVMFSGRNEKYAPSPGGFAYRPETLLLYPPHIDAVIWNREFLTRMNGLDNRVPYLGEHITMMMCLLQGGSAWLAPSTVARFEYLDAGLTQQAQQSLILKKHLSDMFGVLIAESRNQVHATLFQQVLRAFQTENIPDFDTYLSLLSRLSSFQSFIRS